MAVVRPFRGLRPVPSRVDPGAFVAPGVDVDDDAAAALLARDPRNVISLLRGDAARARFLVSEQLRAGVVTRDRLPSLYVLKTQGDVSRSGFFAVVRADSVDAAVDADAGDARVKDLGLGVEPVVISYVDKKGRVARSLESETEREPDATFTSDGVACELWAVDDDSAAARVTSLLEGAPLNVRNGGRALAAQRGLVGDSNDDGAAAAAGFALAFFVDEEDPTTRVPLGVVLHTLDGVL